MKSLRSHLTYANVAATMALLFAMSGSAIAAKHYLVSSTSQIKPSVLKKLRGARGPAGGTGAQGQQGTTGKQGPEGAKGEPGPLLTTLPSGKSLYGTYAITGHQAALADDRTSTQVSFPIPLAAAPTETVLVPHGEPNPDAARCPGTAASPAASPGTLCVYEGQREDAGGTKVCAVVEEGLCGPGIAGAADRFGAAVITFATGDGTYTSWGTWAVTAP